MTNEQLELAAEIVFDLCRKHPEICPHDFREKSVKTNEVNNTIDTIRVCNICGKRIIETKRI